MNTLVSSRPLSLRQTCSPAAGAALAPLARLAVAWSRLRRLLHTWAERDRARRELRGLDAATLRDVGISRADADFEGSKPFWRA